jgi:hypothetical protein
MMIKWLWILLGLQICFSAAWAQTDQTKTTINGSNYVRYDVGKEVDSRLTDQTYPDNTTPRRFFEDRLLLNMTRGNLRLGGRFLYFRPSREDNYRDGLQNENRIDKRFAELSVNPLKVRVGNFGDLWGHGLALSSYENRDLYFDSELDGFRGELTSEPFSVVALRGSSDKGRLVEAAEVTGAHAAVNFFGQGLGYSYVFIDSGAYSAERLHSIDWRLQYEPVTLYGERVWNETKLKLHPQDGHATFVGGLITHWGWSLEMEYKDYYYRVATPFQNPAIVFRDVGPRLLQAREPHVMNIPDEVGYQIELSGDVREGTSATLHYNASSKHHDYGPNGKQPFIPMPYLSHGKFKQADAPYWEYFASIEQSLPQNRSLYVEVGGNEEAAVVWQKRLWVWGRLTTPIFDQQELDIEGQTLFITDRLRDDQKFNDNLISLAWDDGKGFTLTASYELSNDRQVKNRDGNNWPSVEASLSMGGGKHRLIAFYGRERGGLRCSSGVCRQVQAFEGMRLTLETSL